MRFSIQPQHTEERRRQIEEDSPNLRRQTSEQRIQAQRADADTFQIEQTSEQDPFES